MSAKTQSLNGSGVIVSIHHGIKCQDEFKANGIVDGIIQEQ